MGIQGFTKFINDKSSVFFDNYELHDCNLLIDGHSISCQLYNWNHWHFDARSMNCYGGDYDKYAYIVENFFWMLKEVKVKPIVIFDGGFEQRKLPTILTRMKNKIIVGESLNSSIELKNPNRIIYPLFLREAFKDILKTLDIEMVMCQYEGDGEIASIAKLLNCPVLTFDSDYFLLGAQYIPFKTLDCKVRSVENWRTGTYKCISCKIYRIEKLLEAFDGLGESSLHILPVLMGNDYIDQSHFQSFLKSLNLLNVSNQARIEGILSWLRDETTKSALIQILKSFGTRKEREDILRKIKKIMSGYYYVESNLLKYLKINPKSKFKQKNFSFESLEEELSKETDLDDENDDCDTKNNSSDNEVADTDVDNSKTTENGTFHSPKEPPDEDDGNKECIPENTQIDSDGKDDGAEISSDSADKEHSAPEMDGAEISSDSADKEHSAPEIDEILKMTECNLDKENESKNPVSKLFLRNFTKCQYPSSFMDILTQNTFYCIPQMENYSKGNSHIHSLDILRAIHKILTGGKASDLTIVGRAEGTSVKVLPREKFTAPVPSLEEIEDLTLQGRREALLTILAIDRKFISVLEHFPTEWHTFLLSLKYAVSKTNFETPLIYSLVLCFIILNYVDQRIGYYRSMKRYQKKYLAFMQQLPQESNHVPFRVDKNCFYYFPLKDCIVFMHKIVNYFNPDPKESEDTFDKDLLHSMAEIQSVMLHIKYLNSLLKSPYPNLSIHQIFDGTFIYNLTKVFKIKSAELQNNYLNVFFKDCPTVLAGLKYVLNTLNQQIIL